MKKIIAILISLLFVASTLSFASANGDYDSSSIDCCDPANFDIDKTSVKVGETFTVLFNSLCMPEIADVDQEEFIEKINFKIYDSNGNILANFDPREPYWPHLQFAPDIWYSWTYKAVKPGTVVFKGGCDIECEEGPCEGFAFCSDCYLVCKCSKTVTITSRALPMDKFMKFFGLGKKD